MRLFFLKKKLDSNKPEELNSIPVFFVIIINSYLILLSVKLSGMLLDLTLPRLILLFSSVFFIFIYTSKGLLRYRWSLTFVVVLAYLTFLFLSAFLNENVVNKFEIIFQITYTLFLFIAALSIFRNLNETTYYFICNVKFLFLLVYFCVFLYMFLTLGKLNGGFKNTVYFQLALIPFILSLRSRFKVVFGLALISVSGLLIGKRTVFILASLSVVFYYFMIYRVGEGKASALKALFFLIFCFGIVKIIGDARLGLS